MFNLVIRLPRVINHAKRYSSALFISDDKARDTFSVLTPHIDFDDRLKDKDGLEENINLRGVPIKLNEILSVWIFYKKLLSQKNDLEQVKVNIAKTIRTVDDVKEIDRLKLHGKMIREDLKAVKDAFYSLEENAILKALSIPNVIHKKTPVTEPLIVHTFGTVSETTKSHMEYQNLIKYTNPDLYYLLNEAALFELGSTFHIDEELLRKNFTKFSNSDFTKSVVVEGCGFDYSDPKQVFTLLDTTDKKHENSRLHLTGGASLTSFMAYHTKHTIFPSLLPLKYFTIGRKYNPVTSNEHSLLTVSQETAAEIFVATKDNIDDMNSEFDNVLKLVVDIYESFGYHFQVVYRPVKELRGWESLRASVEMYSGHLGKYVEVGHVSVCDNYVSKRLLFNYGKPMSFPRVISGTLFSVPKVLACVIENSPESLLHDSFKKYLS